VSVDLQLSVRQRAGRTRQPALWGSGTIMVGLLRNNTV
jgi:hypothetical protein